MVRFINESMDTFLELVEVDYSITVKINFFENSVPFFITLILGYFLMVNFARFFVFFCLFEILCVFDFMCCFTSRNDIIEFTDFNSTIAVCIEKVESNLDVLICHQFFLINSCGQEFFVIDHTISIQINFL